MAPPAGWKSSANNAELTRVRRSDAAFGLLPVSDRIATTRRKLQAYLRNGVRLAMLIDARRRRLYLGREGAVCAASDVMRQDADEHEPGGEQAGRHSPQT